jgi:hypothetical protein
MKGPGHSIIAREAKVPQSVSQLRARKSCHDVNSQALVLDWATAPTWGHIQRLGSEILSASRV